MEKTRKEKKVVVELLVPGVFEVTVPGVFSYILPVFNPSAQESIDLEFTLEIGHHPDKDILEEMRTVAAVAIESGSIPGCEGYSPLTAEQFNEITEEDRDLFDIPGRLEFRFPVFNPGHDPLEMQFNFKAGLLPTGDMLMDLLKEFNRTASKEICFFSGYKFVPLHIFKSETELVEKRATKEELVKRFEGKIMVKPPQGVN